MAAEPAALPVAVPVAEEMAVPPTEMGGVVDASSEPAAQTTPSEETEHGEETTVLVSNFVYKERSQDDVEARLREFFGPCGHIVEVRIPTFRRSTSLRGYAFIKFGSALDAKAAILACAAVKMERRRLRIHIVIDGSLIR